MDAWREEGNLELLLQSKKPKKPRFFKMGLDSPVLIRSLNTRYSRYE